MDVRTLRLVSFRQSARMRAHFAIFVPSARDERIGTLIHVVGAPMAGYRLEFKRNYCPDASNQPHTVISIGQVYANHVVDSANDLQSIDDRPNGDIEVAATQVPPPRISENFLQPVNDTTNRRCQEWTTDYVRRLVDLGYIGEEAVNTVHAQRDPPSHGIGLQAAGRGQGGRGQGGQAAAGPAEPAAQASPSSWVWDENYNRYRRWNGTEWIWQ
ncbi:hypothetical protein L207DRAFT_571503 [Hyaloscypha variabilis F]|uniref:Uncharacterized protein n=1 Tax=Hyaloscypha variabilis (strain UAMH 11265 / GT02V1 / F) TaxID=1149755 RepID=A0A2J6R4B6_HYAVF|nr:hypothetical protein L207DRAFT_571503 [Hyaloscypha variabilis F]